MSYHVTFDHPTFPVGVRATVSLRDPKRWEPGLAEAINGEPGIVRFVEEQNDEREQDNDAMCTRVRLDFERPMGPLGLRSYHIPAADLVLG